MFVFDLNYEELEQYRSKSSRLEFKDQLSNVVDHNFLTEKFLIELNCVLTRWLKISNDSLNELSKLYELLWVIRLLCRFLEMLDKCSITLDNFTDNIDSKKTFTDFLTEFLEQVIRLNMKSQNSEENDENDEIAQIKQKIKADFGYLEFSSLKVLVSSPEGISAQLSKVLVTLKENKTDQETENFIKYISNPVILKNIPEHKRKEFSEY